MPPRRTIAASFLRRSNVLLTAWTPWLLAPKRTEPLEISNEANPLRRPFSTIWVRPPASKALPVKVLSP